MWPVSRGVTAASWQLGPVKLTLVGSLLCRWGQGLRERQRLQVQPWPALSCRHSGILLIPCGVCSARALCESRTCSPPCTTWSWCRASSMPCLRQATCLQFSDSVQIQDAKQSWALLLAISNGYRRPHSQDYRQVIRYCEEPTEIKPEPSN